jgi:hypothetical protein
MKPASPEKKYMASIYRYNTMEKQNRDIHFGKLDVGGAMQILSSTDYWDGKEWHKNAGWTGNTVNRFAD